jgi:ACS family hexuronate transporter-like MFS transporter
VLAWKFLYYPPEVHPYIGEAEREMLFKSKEEEATSESRAFAGDSSEKAAGWIQLLRLPHTWGIILSRSVTDPVWFLIMEWFAIYLVSKGFKLENTLLGFAGPYIAGDLGNFFGGGLSSELIRREWPVLRARKFVLLLGTLGMILLIPAVYTSNLTLIVLFFSIASFAYATWSTMLLALPTDIYPSSAVASVTGLSLTAGGVGTILSTYLIGTILDHYSFKPVIIAASLAPLIGTCCLFLLVRSRSVKTEV